jgi:CheY-like chemotaxis protein
MKSFRQPNILLLEGDVVCCDNAREFLLKRVAGATVMGAKSIKEAIASMRVCPMDVAIVDWSPKRSEMPAHSMIRLIRGEFPQTLIVIWTAYSSKEMIDKCLAAGAFEVLTKPITMESLLGVVRKAIQQSQNGRITMADVEINTSLFTGAFAAINGTALFPISTLALLRSMVTVGYKNEADSLGYGWRSIGWHISTCFLTVATTATRNGNLVVSKLFHSLDSSEKNTVSYRLGMGLTKFAAETKLKVPWLVHLDRLFNSGTLTLQAGSLERGDLAGQDTNGAWHVLESKGRSSPPSPKLLTKSKNQVSRVLSINGQPPATRSASIVHLYRDPIRTEVVDPEGQEGKQVKIEIVEQEYFPAYYSLLLQLLDLSDVTQVTIANSAFMVSRFDFGGVGFGIGLAESVRHEPANARRACAVFASMDQRERDNEKMSIGLDGTIVLRM